jgi:lysophospholipase L1-like esterase
MRILLILAIASGAATLAIAITPGAALSPVSSSKSTTKAKSTAAKKAATKAPAKKKYLSSSGKASPSKAGASKGGASKTGASKAPVVAPKKTPPLVLSVKPAPQTSSQASSPSQPALKPAPSTPSKAPSKIQSPSKQRVLAHEAVYQNVANGADIPVENPAALVPFFEQLYRHQQGQMPGPVRILHYGDSHTAADEWTGEMRARLQEKFGDGGSGYSFAGRPYNGYRREDVRSGSTSGWHTDGLVGRAGDGVYGLGGISMSVRTPKEGIYVEADASDFELYYYQQPGGGSLQLYDNGVPVERISTDGEPSPAYYHLESMPGPHKLELETLDRAPVRLFGWVAEKPTGITYETLGINGASAPIVLDWNEETLRSNLERRNPALIVLAYGTNEAGQKAWTLDSYREMFEKLIARFRAAAPTATIFVIGPPDRDQRTAKKGWQPMDQLDMIVEAQREAAVASGCPFWDLRAKMGGKGSMSQWVTAGMAQVDHVHFTGPGYSMLGDAVVRDLMSQYDLFLKARGGEVVAAQITAPAEP